MAASAGAASWDPPRDVPAAPADLADDDDGAAPAPSPAAAAAPASFQIFYQNLAGTGQTKTLDVLPSDTVFAVKQRLQEKEGVPADRQRLTLSGGSSWNLEDGRTVAECNIQCRNQTFQGIGAESVGREAVASTPWGRASTAGAGAPTPRDRPPGRHH